MTAANLGGAFVAGLLVGRIDSRRHPSAALRALLVTGLMGGLTTYSTLALDVARHLRDGAPAAALGEGLGSVVAGALLAVAGLRLGRGRR